MAWLVAYVRRRHPALPHHLAAGADGWSKEEEEKEVEEE